MKNIMIIRNCFIVFLFSILAFVSFAQSDELHLESRMKKTDEFRAVLDWQIDKYQELNSNKIKLTVKGQGKFNGLQNSYKEIEAFGEEVGNEFRVLKSRVKLFDKNTDEFVEYKKAFDYVNKVVTYERTKSQKERITTKSFPIKGPICDDATMVYCVSQLLANNENVGWFYLVTNEPKMYKVMIFDRGVEQVDNRVVRKFQLIADLGKLTKFIIKFIPATYVWYEESLQYEWFQYEGMEGGRWGANIVISPVSLLK